MSASQPFLDNLENLRLSAAVALEHVQRNRDAFAISAPGVQIRRTEKLICQIRIIMVQLEKEFTVLEYLISESGQASAAANAD